MSWPDGRKYIGKRRALVKFIINMFGIGNWKDNLNDGEGTMIQLDGSKYVGKCSDIRLIGSL